MKKILYISSTLPALTVTFIYKEIFRLQEIGFDIACVSMNTPASHEISPEARPLTEMTTYLDQVSLSAKVAGFVMQCVRHPFRAVKCFVSFLASSPTNGVRDYARLAYHLLEAGYLARNMRHAGFQHIHCHFINGPTSIGMYLAQMLGIPYSFTMHASMIWLDPIAFRNKLRSCSYCISISEYNRSYVLQTYGEEFADKIHIVHCGIDPEPESKSPAAWQPGDKLMILGVGQLNPRKGFHVLLVACERLKSSGIDFHCTIVGEGDQRAELERDIERLSLTEQVTLTGAVSHEVVDQYIGDCHIFVLPCVVSEDGWRDGIPVALMEAMFHRRIVISTDILGLPELIEHQRSGFLVKPNDGQGLATTIESVAADSRDWASIGEQANLQVRRQFNNVLSATALAELFNES